jgi:chromosome segregation ATPase
MVKDDSKDFNLDEIEDEEYANALYQEEMKDLRVEKINQRVTIITILIPCLIAVVLYIAYRDLTGRVTKSEFSGSKEVQALSMELEEKFIHLSKQNSEFQTTLTEKITDIEKSANSLNNTLKSLHDTVNQLKQNLNKTRASLKSISASKIDKKEHAASIEKVNATLVPIRKELEVLIPVSKDLSALSSEIKVLDKRVKEDLTSISESLTKTNKDLMDIQSNFTTLADQKIDKSSLELEMFKAKKNYERSLEQAVVKIDRKLRALLKRTKKLETNLKQLEATTTKIPVTQSPTQPKTPKNAEIEEQDIKE